jgi:phage major head subunit gpT-like protein
MGIIKKELLTDLYVNFSGLFKQGLASAPSVWKKVATMVPSSAATTAYGWLGRFPQLREWVGDRVIKDMVENAYMLPNKKFEGTVAVSRSDIEDDNLGMYSPIVQSMGEESELHIDRNVFSQLGLGLSELCYDGQNFFDTDHPVYPNHDGTGVAVSTSNIINPLVTDGPAWYLLDASKVIKPLIYQNRSAAELQTINDPQNDAVFMRDEYLYGVRARRAFGFSFWQMAVMSRDALNEENFNAAYQAMCSFKADGGDPLGLRPTILVVPPALRADAKALIEVERLANGASNPNYKVVEVLDTAWLA